MGKMDQDEFPRSTFRDYIRSLLVSGKTSSDEEFQVLFRVLGKDRVVSMALEIKKELADEKLRK